MALWYILALLSGLFWAIEFVFIKKLVKGINPYILTFVLICIELVVSLPFMFWELRQWPMSIAPSFWPAVVLVSLCYVSSSFLLVKVLESTDVSLAMPLTSLWPILTYIFSFLIIGEQATMRGVVWMVVVLLWNYGLYSYKDKSLMQVLAAPFSSHSARLMVLVCLIWAVGNPIGKIAIEATNTFFYVTSSYIAMVLAMLPFFLYHLNKEKKLWPLLLTRRKPLLAWGCVRWLTRTLMLISFSFLLVGYVIATKRLSIVFAILLGRIFLQEKWIGKKLWASAVMIIWILIIIFKG